MSAPSGLKCLSFRLISFTLLWFSINDKSCFRHLIHVSSNEALRKTLKERHSIVVGDPTEELV